MNNFNLQNLKSNVILFVESPWAQTRTIITNFLKSKFCKDANGFCNNCLACQKIDSKNLYDIKIFDGYLANVKKEDVIEIQNHFNFSSLEEWDLKVAVIYGVETLNNFAYNTLLKTLESLSENSLFIMTTRNLNVVPSTIKSRSQVINVLETKREEQKLVKEIISDENKQESIFNTYYSIEDFKIDLENGEFNELYELALNIFHNHDDERSVKDILSAFKKLTPQSIQKIFFMLLSKIEVSKKGDYLQAIKDLRFLNNKTLIYNLLLGFLS